MAVTNYVELSARTAFSFGDGAVTPERLAECAAALGYGSLGVTDAADLGGIVRFAVAGRRLGVRPIVGAELAVDGRPLTLLVRTAEGCRNLGALVTLAQSGELAGWSKPAGGVRGRRRAQGARGPPPQQQDASCSAAEHHRIDAERGVLRPNGTWRLQSPAEVARRWAGGGAGLEASAGIAAACDFDLAWLRPPLPRFPMPGGGSDDAFLEKEVMKGAMARWKTTFSDAHCDQLRHELDVIAQLGFSGFFLVMWDAVRFARSRNILCQWRGSAANSAVAYALGITAVDPVANDLLFERFLSVARAGQLTEAPDIDLDVEHDRREELLDCVYGHWHRESAAITCVVQHYSASTAVQDAMRAFGCPPELATPLSKRLHHKEPAAGARLLAGGLAAEFGLGVTGGRGRALLVAVAAFEGLPRLRSTHPGGFVLSSAPLGDYCPVEPTTRGRTVIQFDKDDLDSLGVPKFDFLGLGALSHVRRAFDLIEARTGVRPDLYAQPQDDAATFAMIARGDTLGTFQIESRAQIASLVHTRPERLYDLVVQVALIRPGPIQARFVRPYTERRRGREQVRYPDGLAEQLAPILRRTQGIPIFQEQAMALSMALAGYTATEADELRRTMGNMRKLPRLAAALHTAADVLPLAAVRGGGAQGAGASTDGETFAPRQLRQNELVALDYAATGISTVGHPMTRWRRALARLGAIDSAALGRCRGGELVIVGGLVSVRQQPATAKGTVFLLLEDEHGLLNVIVPQPLVEPNREAVRHATFLAVYGRAERSGALVNVVARAFKAFGESRGDQGVVHRSHDFR